MPDTLTSTRSNGVDVAQVHNNPFRVPSMAYTKHAQSKVHLNEDKEASGVVYYAQTDFT